MMDRLMNLVCIGILLFCSTCTKETPPDPCELCVAPLQCFEGQCVDPCSAGLIDCGPLACVNGECVCPRGFQGADCDEEKTPRQIFIEEIWVFHFAILNSMGEQWDQEMVDGTGLAPDIYPWVNEDENRGRYRNLTITDASPEEMHIFKLTDIEPYVVDISSPIENTGFSLWDRDESLEEDDYFFNATPFLPYEKGRPGFPERDTLTIDTRYKVVIRYGF